MGEPASALQQVLADVRRRCGRRAWLRAWTLAAAAAAVPLLCAWLTTLLIAREGWPLALTLGLTLPLAVVALVWALWPLRRCPSDLQLARYIEERAGGLDDVLVTAVGARTRPDASPRMRAWLEADAATALTGFDLNRVISRRSLRGFVARAAVATALLVAVGLALAPSVRRSAFFVSAHLFPARLALHVTPGTTTLRAGTPLLVTVRVEGSEGSVRPVLRLGSGDAARSVEMTPNENGVFSAELNGIAEAFSYSVAAASLTSDLYTVSVIHPPVIERIDLRFEYPPRANLASRVEEDGGDIYAPAGTRVQVSVTADKPLANGHLLLADGQRIPLSGTGAVFEGGLTVGEDTSYRIAVTDTDGLQGGEDVEYFVRTLFDRPPDVQILRPGGDREVTALEEVLVEARAEDDFGIASLDLVFQAPGGAQKMLPLPARGTLAAEGARTIFLEDLGVSAGDIVSYYARARDTGHGRPGVESRSDIFFLEVKPFNQAFNAAQSQSMMQGAAAGGLQELAEAQKEIVVATWNLDARSRRSGARSKDDVGAVAKAQGELKARAEAVTGSASVADPRRRRGAGPRPGLSTSVDSPMARAVAAMGSAKTALDGQQTAAAIPHEMEALNQLLKAAADNRQRQVARQQQASGGGNGNRSGPDLSTLFDQELRKRQETNYEQPGSTETREDERTDDPLARVRELARRQEALNREQQRFANERGAMDEAEQQRQLERLSREQQQLRRDADELAKQMQSQSSPPSSGSQQQPQQAASQGQSQAGSQGRSSGGGSQGAGTQGQQAAGRQLREAARRMQEAASGLQRDAPQDAQASASRALDTLRGAEQQMEAGSAGDRQRALGDLQLETQQLADAARRLGSDAERSEADRAGVDTRRRLAGEHERLADRADRLQAEARRLADANRGSRGEQRAIDDAARELERQRVAERMREAAGQLRASENQGASQPGTTSQGAGTGSQSAGSPGSNGATPTARPSQGGVQRTDEEVARTLDQVADHLAEASGSGSAEQRRLSDQLGRTQELRETLSGLQQELQRLDRQGSQGQPATAGGGSGQGDGGGSTEQGQEQVSGRMRDAERQLQELAREHPELRNAQPAEGWWRSLSAPGTEGFKQDFARWESLKQHLEVALERVEAGLSNRLRNGESRERLNAGRHEGVPDAYREDVERYYRSLAAPRRTPR